MVPINAPGWDLGLDVGAGDGFFVFRKDGLPNYGVMSGSGSSPTNLVGCLVRKTGDEHFLLLPNPPDTNVIAGTYYFGVVSEGQNASGTRAGSNFCSFTFASEGPLTPANLGTVDPLGQTGLVTQATQDGGEILGYQFSVLPNTPVFEVRLTNRVANPWMSLRADAQYGDPYDPAYGNLGGWAARWSDSSVIRVPWPVAGVYTLLVQAASFNGQYTNTSYTLQVAAQSALTPAFDGGTTVITNQPADGWNYFLIRVPPDALGWDLRLTNIITGSPRLVVCRAGWPYDLTSRFTNGTAWAWGAATNWPVGAQAAPGIDSSGYRYETNRYDSSGTNLVDTTGTVFAAGMGSPLEPGNYIIGVSSAPGGGHKFQKGGGENALLGELNGQTNVPPGTYYVAVIGEGAGAQPAKSIIGAGLTDYALSSTLPFAATNLGTVLAGAADVLVTNTLQRGETAAYQFTMMTNALNHTISLESVAGTPLVRLRNDPHLPLDIYNTYAYGQDGSYTPAWTGVTNVINNPANGFYSLALLANGASTNWAPLQYTLGSMLSRCRPTCVSTAATSRS